MTKSHRRIRRTPEQWHKILDELISSGLDRKTFCEQRGLRREALRRAERRLNREKPTSSQFIEVAPPPAAEVELSRGWDVELDLGDGLVLRLARR